VADLATLAIGFGLMPVAALTLFLFRNRVLAREDTAWAILAGSVAFLGIAHASATALVDVPVVRLQTDIVVAGVILGAGLVLGLAVGRILLVQTGGPSSLVATLAWGGLAYLALHSFDDGFVLGTAFAGPLPIGWTLTAANVSATFLHRFVEGALVVVPALGLSWKIPKTLTLLLAGLAGVPGAYVAVNLGSGTGTLSAAVFGGFDLFVVALEVGLALQLLLIGYLPKLAAATDRRWTAWAGIAFLAMFLLHLLVE
jgi:hypothetical protein